MYEEVGTHKSFSDTGKVFLVSLDGRHRSIPSVSFPFVSTQCILYLCFVAFVFICVIFHNKNEL